MRKSSEEADGTRVSRRLLRYIFPHAAPLFVALLAMLVSAWCEFGYVSVFSDTTDALKLIDSVGFDEPLEVRYFAKEGYFDGVPYVIHNAGEALKLVFFVLGMMLMLVTLKASLSYLQTYLIARIRYKVVIRLRREVFHRVASARLGQIQGQRTGDLLSRFIDDASVIQNAISATGGMLHASVTVLVFLVVMLITSWQLTLLTLLVSPSLGYLLSRLQKPGSTEQRTACRRPWPGAAGTLPQPRVPIKRTLQRRDNIIAPRGSQLRG